MRFVADDEIPAAVGRLELILNAFIAGELIETRNHQVVFKKPVAGARGFELVVGQNIERQVEATVEFILPLIDQATGANN